MARRSAAEWATLLRARSPRDGDLFAHEAERLGLRPERFVDDACARLASARTERDLESLSGLLGHLAPESGARGARALLGAATVRVRATSDGRLQPGPGVRPAQVAARFLAVQALAAYGTVRGGGATVDDIVKGLTPLIVDHDRRVQSEVASTIEALLPSLSRSGQARLGRFFERIPPGGRVDLPVYLRTARWTRVYAEPEFARVLINRARVDHALSMVVADHAPPQSARALLLLLDPVRHDRVIARVLSRPDIAWSASDIAKWCSGGGEATRLQAIQVAARLA